jgi:hypothetical protein
MDKNTVDKLVTLRQHMIGQYSSLDGNPDVSTTVMKQQDVALMLETLIKSVDDLLRPHVNFS